MCGRYASSRGVHDLTSYFEVDEDGPDDDGADEDGADEQPPPTWNVAPTDPVPAVLERDGRRRLTVLRWGLVPSWAKDAKGAARLINARRESVADKPAFRAAYRRRRCLLPADGYYEWQVTGGRKQPWFLSMADGSPLAMAGLYEVWADPQGRKLWTCTVLTTDAADELGQIHDRTPLLVPRQDWGRWLDPGLEEPGQDLLVPGTSGLLTAWPVGTAVGNVRNDGPELVRPVEPDALF